MRRPAQLQKGVYLLPNLCTTASLFCGFYSVVKSLSGDFFHATWAILVAGLLDFLDGRIARLTKTQSAFGIQYDSLVDLVSFGFAPGLLVYTWSLYQFKRVGWLAAFLFVACGALRLARFNVQTGTMEKRYFQGLPIPSAAYTLVGLVLFYQFLYGEVEVRGWFPLFLTITLALLMVSKVRYRSFKDIDWGSRQSFYYLVFGLALLTLVALAPDIVIFFGGIVFASSGPVLEILNLRKKVAEAEQRRKGKARRFQVLSLEEKHDGTG
ncbi:MAG: CDP-diacylglycerol--serine O-phosphatidyltransferase [Deltaproteobacteria bacterium]|nr:CDP-diacylglycerol--serine O-phosphatidyltransferase [Deltaproteobacteria bacterium]